MTRASGVALALAAAVLAGCGGGGAAAGGRDQAIGGSPRSPTTRAKT
jgi:hypothetical protein